MQSFKEAIIAKVENREISEVIDLLITEFPRELHDRLWSEVEDFDDYDARDYLTAKLIERKIALLPSVYKEIPQFMEVINANPQEVVESLERAHEAGTDFFLGSGHNAEVIASTREAAICYKTLFLERAAKVNSNVAHEALLQFSIQETLKKQGLDKHVPAVFGFVKTKEVQAIKMERIRGFNLKQFLDNPIRYELPENFNVNTFFDTLETVIRILNSEGFFHRDLYENAGNVMCSENGEPILIDFGSAVKACNYDLEEETYELVPNGQRYHKYDLQAIINMKKRVVAAM